MAKMVYLVLLHIFLSFVLTQSAPKESLITKLPGFHGAIPSKHYAGYVTVDERHGRNLYYYFVESESNPSKDPLVLWLNGGPACSSFDGFIYEHGPFNFIKSKKKGALPKLQLNPYSWSKVSNIIYLDSPAGTGFSYSKNTSDYETGDIKTASDTHTFLLKWIELYPEFLANPLFIAGESYAGVYIPTLADKIVQGIEAGTKPKLNFKGYMVGNPVTDDKFDGNALVPFAHGMGLISDELFQNATKECNAKFYETNNEECSGLLSKIDKALEEINVYNILEPCYHGENTEENKKKDSKLPQSFRQLGQSDRFLPVRKRMFGRAWPHKVHVKEGIVPTWPQLTNTNNPYVPCTDDEVSVIWLNNRKVRRAIHTVEESVVKEWVLCTGDEVAYTHDTGSMIPYHKKLISKGYRVLAYSGDHDMCVPFTGTQRWSRSMGLKIVEEWRPWLLNHQVSGFTQRYANNFTFLTIKGSGHTVPEYKPKEALYFYQHFINGLVI